MATQTFPPTGPTGLTATILAYLYEEYADDSDLQAFFASYNSIAQAYVDWFNNVGLSVYTNPSISGGLLDWVAQGLYGMTRPQLSSGFNRNLGPLNTWALNTLPLNTIKVIGPSNVVVTTDDIFKRILTWHVYKGDGKVFTVRWLKRRIMRFLLGVNGTDPGINNTSQISVSFGLNAQVNITFLSIVRSVTGGAILNRFGMNTLGSVLNSLQSTAQTFTPLPNTVIFQEAVQSGALELPFQFTWVVNIQ